MQDVSLMTLPMEARLLKFLKTKQYMLVELAGKKFR